MAGIFFVGRMSMFNPEDFQVGGVMLLALVFGLVQFIKEMFKLQGTLVTAVAAGLGVALMVMFQLIELLPPIYAQVVRVVVISLAFGMSASGFYKFVNARVPPLDMNER
jgi:hypothetical protein